MAKRSSLSSIYGRICVLLKGHWVRLGVGGISHSEFALDAPISITLSVCSVSQSEVGTQSGTVCADGMPLYPTMPRRYYLYTNII